MGTTVQFKKLYPHFQRTNIHKLASAFPKGIQRSRNQCSEETPKNPAATPAVHLTQSRASCSSPPPHCVLTACKDIWGRENNPPRQFSKHRSKPNFFPPKGEQQRNCKFGPKSSLASRLQNVLRVWQRGSKISLQTPVLERFPVQLLRVWISIQMSKSCSE